MTAIDREAKIKSSEASSLGAPAPVDPYEEAAMRGRVAARLFGAAPSAVRIGRYEVADRIGAGSMGVVYSARDPDLGRLVALKILSSPRSEDLRHRQRLVSEARVLARLSHPNVVQIHEVGIHDGALFLALELVEGETLQAWQRRGDRRWPELLSAYVDAARGLAAAHGVGVVHRDIKPSNILVGIDGRVRVADFGLARDAEETPAGATAGSHAGAHAGSTHTGPVVGTPAYMSPEQARGREVDARSDQFSLCVALFEALYGIRPFDTHELHRLTRLDPAALRRLVPRDSAAPRWLFKLLLRGLDPEPARRYPDLGALLEALHETPRRAARRRIFGAGGAALALGAWAAFTLPQPAIVCPAPGNLIPGSWDTSTRAEGRRAFVATGLPFAAEAWSRVERDLDAAVLAWSRERRASCIATWIERTQSQEQLDLGAACFSAHERELRGLALRLRTRVDPGIVAHAHELVAGLGDPSRCTRIEHLRRPFAPTDPVTRQAVDVQRDRIAELRLHLRIADLESAKVLADEILATASVHAPLRPEALLYRAVVHRMRGEPGDAARLLDEAEALAEQHRDDPLVTEIFAEQLELAIHGLRDVARARIYARLYAAKLARGGADDAARADYHDRHGELELLAEEPAAALEQHELAARLRTAEDLVGRARSARGAANALAQLGHLDTALGRHLATRELLASELGESHPDVAVLDMDIGLTLRDMGELTRAREALLRARDIEARSASPGDVGAARTRCGLAEVHLALGDVDAAFTEATSARPVLERALPPTHDDVASVLALLSNIHLARRDWAGAADHLDRLIRGLRAGGAEIPAEMHINAGEYRLRMGRVADAAPHFDQALVLLSAEETPNLEHLAHALNGRAKVHLEQAQPLAAIYILERAIALLPEIRHTELRAEVLGGMARALHRTGGDRSRIRSLAREALALFATLAGTEDYAAALRRELGIE